MLRICSSNVAIGIGHGHARVNRMVSHQVSCRDILAVDQCSVRACNDACRVSITVDRQGHYVTQLGVTAHGASYRCIGLVFFRSIDDVVTSNGVDRDGGRGLQVHRQHGRVCCRCCDRAVFIGRRNTRIHTGIANQVSG